MQTQSINLNETLSLTFLAYLKQQIASFRKNPSDEIIIDTIKVCVNEISNQQIIKAKEVKQEIEDNLKGELATKDFVRAEINQVRTEMAEMKQELKLEIAEVRQELNVETKSIRQEIKSIRQEMKFYAIGIAALMIVLQPQVFSFLTSLFK
ncbi:MAG: hypothetical protein SOW25_05585 [Helicobacter sp.]|nr:hypothetical protein [Helicobacter sp.]